MKIISASIPLSDLQEMAGNWFGNMVKAVVDIERQLLAIDAEMHADLESLLLENGSLQKDLWGINLYPELFGGEFVEFDSMINLRPGQNNRTRGVESEEIRKQILQIVQKRVAK